MARPTQAESAKPDYFCCPRSPRIQSAALWVAPVAEITSRLPELLEPAVNASSLVLDDRRRLFQASPQSDW
jgi:hypothetical protein